MKIQWLLLVDGNMVHQTNDRMFLIEKCIWHTRSILQNCQTHRSTFDPNRTIQSLLLADIPSLQPLSPRSKHLDPASLLPHPTVSHLLRRFHYPDPRRCAPPCRPSPVRCYQSDPAAALTMPASTAWAMSPRVTGPASLRRSTGPSRRIAIPVPTPSSSTA